MTDRKFDEIYFQLSNKIAQSNKSDKFKKLYSTNSTNLKLDTPRAHLIPTKTPTKFNTPSTTGPLIPKNKKPSFNEMFSPSLNTKYRSVDNNGNLRNDNRMQESSLTDDKSPVRIKKNMSTANKINMLKSNSTKKSVNHTRFLDGNHQDHLKKIHVVGISPREIEKDRLDKVNTNHQNEYDTVENHKIDKSNKINMRRISEKGNQHNNSKNGMNIVEKIVYNKQHSLVNQSTKSDCNSASTGLNTTNDIINKYLNCPEEDFSEFNQDSHFKIDKDKGHNNSIASSTPNHKNQRSLDSKPNSLLLDSKSESKQCSNPKSFPTDTLKNCQRASTSFAKQVDTNNNYNEQVDSLKKKKSAKKLPDKQPKPFTHFKSRLNNTLNMCKSTKQDQKQSSSQDSESDQKESNSDRDSIDDDMRACNPKSHFISIIGKREYLRFRQIQEISKPTAVRNPQQFFKLIHSIALVKQTLIDNGFADVKSDVSEPTLIWSSNGLSQSFYLGLSRYQKCNHFPHSWELTKKDCLYRNYMKLRTKFGPEEFKYMPITYILSQDKLLLTKAMQNKTDKKWQIVKPSNSSQGKGIQITNKLADIKMLPNTLVSEQIDRPLLVDDLKFDMRLQVIVTSQHPLRVYLQDEGLTRFASEEQEHPSKCKHLQMHLTNYSINKNNCNFEENEDEDEDSQGHKWSQTALLSQLEEHKWDVTKIQANIEDIILKSIISVEPVVTANLKENCVYKSNCFEIQGQDIMLDKDGLAWLVEVNLSASLACGSPLDLKIKGELIRDTFNLIGIVSNQTRDQVNKQDLNPLRTANFGAINQVNQNKIKPDSQKDKRKENWAKLDRIIKCEQGLDPSYLSKEDKHHIRDFEDEMKRMNNMALIFPNKNYDKYKNQFETQYQIHEILSRRFMKKGKGSHEKELNAKK